MRHRPELSKGLWVVETQRRTIWGKTMARMPRNLPRIGSPAGIVGAVAAALVLIVVLSAVHLLPHLRNPFAETTTVSTEPVILKSITALSRYEAASGTFQVVVDVTQHSSLPSFLEGSQTLFVGEGTDIAFVDFSQLKAQAIQVSGAGCRTAGGQPACSTAPAGTGRARPLPLVCSRRAAGLVQPDREPLRRQPEQPAAGLRLGPAEAAGRRSAEPAAERGAKGYPRECWTACSPPSASSTSPVTFGAPAS